jgi:hypothetical protein
MIENQKTQIVILNCGYVESNANWINIFITVELRSSVQEILESLSKAIIDGMYDPEPYVFKNCCKAAKGANAKYCPECGTRIGRRKLTAEQIAGIAHGYLSGTIDGTADAWEKLQEENWLCLGGAMYQLNGENRYPDVHPFQSDATYIYIHEYAAEVLTAAYRKTLAPPGSRTDDCEYSDELEQHVKIFGRDKEELKLYKE